MATGYSMQLHSIKTRLSKHTSTLTIGSCIVVAGVLVALLYSYYTTQQKLLNIISQNSALRENVSTLSQNLTTVQSQDQYKINKALEEEINNIHVTYKHAVITYESLLQLKDTLGKTEPFDTLFTQAILYLADKNYASAGATLTTLDQHIITERQKISSSFAIPQNVPSNNAPPSSGFQQQRVSTDAGDFLVDIISADLASTRVIVDTASDKTCTDNCPVLPLSDYVGRSGAYAGVNGSYFCPESYPSCAGKKNSFDTLLMNKNKVYFNSDNNAYSSVPAAIFGNGWIRFVGKSLEWGRDTSVDGVIAMQPLLVSGGNIAFGGNNDTKESAKGGRSFVANKGNMVYIGVVFNATVAEAAKVHKALGMDNALNLDDGGSVALWSGGYKAGPGRNIPNAILFIRK